MNRVRGIIHKFGIKTIVENLLSAKQTLQTGANIIVDDEDKTALHIDVVLKDGESPQQLLDDLQAIAPEAKIVLGVHKCTHKEFGGEGGPCPKPHLLLTQTATAVTGL